MYLKFKLLISFTKCDSLQLVLEYNATPDYHSLLHRSFSQLDLQVSVIGKYQALASHTFETTVCYTRKSFYFLLLSVCFGSIVMIWLKNIDT